jgi:hypothetical protein
VGEDFVWMIVRKDVIELGQVSPDMRMIGTGRLDKAYTQWFSRESSVSWSYQGVVPVRGNKQAMNEL